MKHPDYPNLFSPIRIGNFEVPNRVCHCQLISVRPIRRFGE